MRGRTRYQGGSLLGYVAVAILLAGLLVGGLYWVQRYNETATNDGVIATETNNENASDDKNASSNSSSATGEDGFSSENNSASSSSTDTATDNSSNTTVDETTTVTADDSTTSESGTETSVQALPETGPATTLAETIILATITFAMVGYVKSRRSLDF